MKIVATSGPSPAANSIKIGWTTLGKIAPGPSVKSPASTFCMGPYTGSPATATIPPARSAPINVPNRPPNNNITIGMINSSLVHYLRTSKYGNSNTEYTDHQSKQSRDRSCASTTGKQPDERDSGRQSRHQQSHCAEKAL